MDNREGFLLPGSFAYVTLKVPMPSQPQVPVAALLQRGGATMVAMPDADGVVHLRPVKVGSTDGVMVNIADGVAVGDRVAINVPNDVVEGAASARWWPADRPATAELAGHQPGKKNCGSACKRGEKSTAKIESPKNSLFSAKMKMEKGGWSTYPALRCSLHAA